MNRPAHYALLISLSLAACEPAPVAVATRALVVSPTAASASTPSQAIPRELSLASGYGFDGGWYQLYFTDPSNPSSAQLSGGPDEPLASAIDSAQLTIDAAIYSLSLRRVRQSLIRAHRRGVNVRVVMESDNMDGSAVRALLDAGIPVLGDRREGLMHNKFIIIDRSEVWTGSMNFTNNGTYADRNNLIHIHSPRLAADYLAEFNEMFVDDRFGPDLGSVTPHPKLVVGGAPIEVYFSPDDHVQAALLGLLGGARTSIFFLAYSFTADPLAEAIVKRAQAGVQVAGVMDDGQVLTNRGTEYDRFRAAGLDVRLGAEQGLMHHKVLIVDGTTVVTGSYNFTASAEETNDENVLVIHDPTIAAEFLQEFERIQHSAKP
ncbi:MAG TPA: phospholipase D-like domain-containing protein [Anaerolineales bacterium]